MSNIPRKIFQFWHDKHAVPPDYARAFACNREMNPHFEFMLIDDTFVDTLLQQHFNGLLVRLYRMNRVPASRCDIARLAVLHRYGGVYLDASLKLRGRLDPIIDATSDTAFLVRDDMPKYQEDPSQAHLWNGLIISRKGSKLIGRCLLEIMRTLTSGSYNTDVLNATGPGVINRVAKNMVDRAYIKLSFKKLKNGFLEHLRISGLRNSWKTLQADGIIDLSQLDELASQSLDSEAFELPGEPGDIFNPRLSLEAKQNPGSATPANAPKMNIILTGIARSGTTLSCYLLNQLPQCVALHEPMNPAELANLEFPEGFVCRIEEFFAEQRRMLLSTGHAVSKARSGKVPDNPFESVASPNQLRASMVTKEQVHFGKSLGERFRLVVKHPNFFTATLEVLRQKFACFALVRNPLAVLLSWHSIKAPVHEGRLPAGELFDSNLKKKLSSEPDCLERQLIILRWYFARYAELLPATHVIKYEELIQSRGQALGVIDPEANQLDLPLGSRNNSRLYDESLIDQLAGRLTQDPSIYEPFYSANDIRELRGNWGKGD